MNLYFADDQQQRRFFRTMRLVHDDFMGYAQAAAAYCAINSQDRNKPVLEALNKNPLFWNSVLGSLQESAISAIGRLNDKAKQKNHLTQFLQMLEKQSPACVKAADNLRSAIDRQENFVSKILNLRNKLVAHTDFEAPLFAAFGFKDLTIPDFQAYWDDLMGALAQCDKAIFGDTPHGPEFDKTVFASITADTSSALRMLSEA